MKTCKKLLAIMLSVLMIASVIVIPASAEEAAAENYVSLLDMGGLRAGLMTEDDATAFPDGLADLGVSRGLYNGTGSAYYSGKQEIIELEDGAKAWKINFNKAMTGGGWYHDNKGLFVAKVAVPEKYVPYVTSIKLDMINASNGQLQYQVGVDTGSYLAKKMKESSTSTTTPDAPVELNLAYDITELGKRSAYDAFNGGGTVVANMTYGEAFSHIYFSLKDTEAEDGGLGYAIIKDIGVTLSIPEADIPVEKEISLWDLSDKDLGALTEYPIGISEFVAEGRYVQYNGTKEVVTNAEGKNVLKLDLNSASFKTACSPDNRIIEGQFSPVYSIKVNIPSDYVQYVRSIKIKFNKQSVMHIAYNFGLTDGTNYSKRNDNGVTMGTAVTGEQVISYTPAQLAKVSAYAAGAYSSYADAAKWDNSFTDLFLWLSAIVPEGTEDAGYITIEDISVTMSASPALLDAFPIYKEFSILDFSNVEVGDTQTGTTDIMPGLDNITRAGYNGMATTYFSGTQSIVEADGNKAWKINFDTAQSGGGYMWDSKELFGIKIAVPTKYLPYISSVSADIENKSATGLRFVFGWSAGSELAKYDKSFTAGTDVDYTFAVDGATRFTAPYGCFNGSTGKSETPWAIGDDMDYVYLALREASNTTAGGTGYAIIKDITVTVAAPQSWHDNMPKEYKTSVWDLSANELGDIAAADVKYTKGVSSNNYSGALHIVEDEKYGTKALRFDLENTEFAKTGDRINESSLSPVYKAKLNIIPSTYAPYVTGINLIVNKQSESKVAYSFGLTDGSQYSKLGEGANAVFGADKSGYIAVPLNPSALYKCSNWDAGAYSKPVAGTTPKWDDGSFNALYLWVSAASGATGYIDIVDISYSYTMSDEQKAEADAEWAEMKTYVNDFESSGSESQYATSGTKVQSISSGNGYSGAGVTLNTNIYLDEAHGFSFWMYNPNETAQSPKLWLDTNSGTRYIISTGYSIAAKSYAKVTVDFNKVYEWAGDNGGYSTGDLISLTKEQKADITAMYVMIRPASTSILVDDVYLIFEEPKTTEDTLVLDSTNVEGAEVTEDGKIKFASDTITVPGTEQEDGTVSADTTVGSDIVAQITVPDKFFSHASSMTLNFDSDVAAEVAVSLLGTNDSGTEAHWKWGYQDQSTTVAAGGAGVDKTFNFAGYNGTNNPGVIHEANGLGSSLGTNCNQCTPPSSWDGSSGHANNPPTPTEKEKITTIVVQVFNNLGTEGQAVTLNSISVTYAGNNITATTVEGGTVTVVESKVWAGDTGAFIVAPAEGYYLKTVSAVDNLGNEIQTTLGGGKDATNLGYYYTFTMPVGHVTVSAEFGAIEGSLPYDFDYEGDNVVLNYTVPFVDGKVYNEFEGAFQNIDDYNVIITSEAAVYKYNYALEDLTPEFIAELKESGHHLGNYIYILNKNNAKIAASNANFIKFTVEITNVSAEFRRNETFALINYTTFTDDEGNATTPVQIVNYDTMDDMYYGYAHAKEFSAKNGINFASSKLPASIEVLSDIKAQGFDHIRLPVTMTNRMDEDYQLIDSEMEAIDQTIENCIKVGLPVVVDTHSVGASISTDYATNAEVYYTVWEQLAERYKNLPLSVAFQFVNEPMTNKTEGNDTLDEEELMEFQEKLVVDCRAVAGNEKRTMVISNHNNASWALGQYTDSILAHDNIVIDIHYYNPMKFTHSGSEGWDNVEGNGYTAGESDYSEADFEGFMTKMKNFAETNNVTVWVGEWGCYQPEYNAKVAYYAEFAKAASDAGVPWALWEYGSGFSPYKDGKWDQEILDAIFKFDAVNNSATA